MRSVLVLAGVAFLIASSGASAIKVDTADYVDPDLPPVDPLATSTSASTTCVETTSGGSATVETSCDGKQQ